MYNQSSHPLWGAFTLAIFRGRLISMGGGGSNPCPSVDALEKYWNRSRHFSKEQNIGLSCLQIGYGHGINDFEFVKDF